MGVAKWVDELEAGSPERRFAAADALERHGRAHPHDLLPYRERLLAVLHVSDQPGVQWHLSEIVPRLGLDAVQASLAYDTLARWIAESPSRIVKADALTAVSRLAHQYPEALMEPTKRLLADAVRSGSPAERARARSLVKRHHDPEH